jgi:Zn-dependent peptidase ImmA (M78 family)
MLKEMECYRLAASLILPYENIHLFAFDDMTDITCDLDNYRDVSHYSGDISDMILEMMAADENRLTLDTYNEYYDEVEQFYKNYDFNELIPK